MITETGAESGIVLDSNYSSLKIPVARREFIRVTEIKRQGEDMTSFRFDWRWEPNIILHLLDPTSVDYKSLPTNMRERLHSVKLDSSFAAVMKATRRGVGDFVNTDNGWRLLELFFDELSV